MRDGDALIGTCGRPTWGSGWAHPPGGPGLAQAARDFEVMRAYRERGHMAEALAAMLRFGFERMGLRRVEAEVAFENRASARPVERVGFHKQAVVASRWSHSKGAYHDLWILAPSCHDWSPPAG